MDGIISALTDRSFQIALLVSVAAMAAIYTAIEPFFKKDKLAERMKSVGNYRENLRQKQRQELTRATQATLRNRSPDGVLKDLVENLNLLEVFDADVARKTLMMAGFRGQGPVFTFMAARLGLPFVVAIGMAVYVYGFDGFALDSLGRMLATLGGFFAGFYLPNLYVTNIVKKRQQAIQQAWPDALDLLLICVESGMSIEAAFQKVGDEVGTNCAELAEEMGLTRAELSYLQERRLAYLNLAERTGLESVKSVVTALVQSEKYGTPLGQSLRVMADESRAQRMQEAEKKAAALPPKLTVPMIGFFLPVLFAVILGPAIMQVMELM